VVRQRRSANRVETEGRHGDEGTSEAHAESNVIRLPRDWLGPRDELVPFGPPAEPSDVEGPAAVPTARAAEFWGEDSAALQDAVPAPAAIERTEPPAPRRRSRVASGRTLSVAAAVVLAAGVVLVELTSSSRPMQRGLSSSASGLAAVFPPALAGVENLPLPHIRAGRQPVHRAAHRVRAARSRRVTPAPSPRSIQVATSVTPTPSPPATTRYVAPVSSRTGSSGTETTVATHAPAPAYRPPAATAATTKVKAFGSSGVLGPGSSPNG
jgi:hypothetical protein